MCAAARKARPRQLAAPNASCSVQQRLFACPHWLGAREVLASQLTHSPWSIAATHQQAAQSRKSAPASPTLPYTGMDARPRQQGNKPSCDTQQRAACVAVLLALLLHSPPGRSKRAAQAVSLRAVACPSKPCSTPGLAQAHSLSLPRRSQPPSHRVCGRQSASSSLRGNGLQMLNASWTWQTDAVLPRVFARV